MFRKQNPYAPGTDEYYMDEALRLAHNGLGWASPNPLVGCVLVRDGQLIGRGYHARDGELHAEAVALADAGDARGATCYVTLEPCSHEGRQPSCCGLLIAAGVERVVFGIEDVDPRSAGRAARVLGAAGIPVTDGVLGEECGRLLDYYLHAKRFNSTFVHLKLAVSLDAKMALTNGASQWLSGPQSLGYAHYLRQKYDAIMVGSGTVLADNPRLTTRDEALSNYWSRPAGCALRHPCRVIFDPRGEVLRSNAPFELLRLAGDFPPGLPKLVIITGSEGPRSGAWSDAAVIPTASGPDGLVNFGPIITQLWNLGIKCIVIEGGVRLAREVLRQGCAHRVSLVYTPKIIGSDGQDFAPLLGLDSLDSCIALKRLVSRKLGEDVLIDGYV